MSKVYTLSKTKVREMLTEKFGKDGEVEVKLSDVLALFVGKSKEAGSTLVKDAEGNVVGKRCSYFGIFMPISEFGKRGEVYAYQCKLAESLNRKARTAALAAKAALDEQLANEEISVAEWKAGLTEIESAKNAKMSIPEGTEYYETADDLLKALQ